jgi:hypothetical protein
MGHNCRRTTLSIDFSRARNADVSSRSEIFRHSEPKIAASGLPAHFSRDISEGHLATEEGAQPPQPPTECSLSTNSVAGELVDRMLKKE